MLLAMHKPLSQRHLKSSYSLSIYRHHDITYCDIGTWSRGSQRRDACAVNRRYAKAIPFSAVMLCYLYNCSVAYYKMFHLVLIKGGKCQKYLTLFHITRATECEFKNIMSSAHKYTLLPHSLYYMSLQNLTKHEVCITRNIYIRKPMKHMR